MALPKLTIFISSPGDVNEERVLTGRVIERLQGEFARRVKLEPVFWEHEPLLASDSFQAQIVMPSQTDIVVCILWSRLGSRLPPDIAREDGSRYASGTEFEFEDAVRGFRDHGRPDLIVYRKTAAPIVSLKDRRQRGDQWAQMEALDDFVDRWFHHGEDGSLVAAFHEYERSALFEETVEAHLRKLIERRLPELPAGTAETAVPITWSQGSPFRGLEFFDIEHAAVFFGRTRAIGDVLTAVRRQAVAARPFVLVLGMSGIGKSSLVRAGVMPMLLQPGVIEGVALWRYAIMRPSDHGGDLFHALAAALMSNEALPELGGDGTTEVQVAESLRRNPAGADLLIKGGLSEAVAPLRRDGDRGQIAARLLLTVDQLEELFTHDGVAPEQRHAFVVLLSGLVHSGRVWVLATMRADLYHRCTDEPELVALVEGAGQYLLAPPSSAEISQMIHLPAAAAGLQFEVHAEVDTRLDDVLLNAAVQSPENIPLLEFTLAELFERRDEGKRLTLAAYDAIGGLEGAIAQRAEDLFETLDFEAQMAMPTLLLSLVTVDAGEHDTVAARRRRLDDLRIDPVRTRLVDALIEARLLVTDQAKSGEASVRVAHEALLSHWPRFKEWLEEDREFLRVRARALAAARNWLAEDRLPACLLTSGKPLADAEVLLDWRRDELSPELIEYIEASRSAARERRAAEQAAQKRQLRRARVLAVVFALLATGAVIGGVVGYLGWDAAEEQTAIAQQQSAEAVRQAGIAEERRAEAERQRTIADRRRDATLRTQSVFLADLAQQQIDAGNAGNGMLLALAALPADMAAPERPYASEAEAALYRAVQENRELRVLRGHLGWLADAAFSPDGRYVVTASSDKTARLWRVDSGEVVAILEGHTDGLSSCRFSADGKTIVTASMDGTARLWNATDGRQIAVFKGHDKSVQEAGISADGARIVTASADGTVRIWDARSAAQVALLTGHGKSVLSAAFSPDGARVASAAIDGGVRLWDTGTGGQLLAFAAHYEVVRSIAFSADGERFVTASDDDTARVWDARSGAPIAVLKGHAQGVSRASFSADGRLIVTASNDRSLRLWDAASGELVAVLGGHERDAVSARFSADGARIVSASKDTSARIWSVRAERRHVVLAGHRRGLTGIAFSGDGTRVVTASGDGGSARIWDATTGQQQLVLDGNNRPLNAVAFDPGGDRLATASTTADIGVWNARSGVLTRVLSAHADAVEALAFSADGTRVVSASRDKTARVWDSQTGSVIRVLEGHTNWVNDAAFNAAGDRIVTASKDRTVRLWDAGTGGQLAVFEGHTGAVSSAAFSPDGSQVVSASDDRTARLWDVASGASTLVLRGHRHYVRDAAFSPSGKQVATVSRDRTVRLWDTRTGQPIAVFRGHRKGVSAAAFSPDGRLLASASDDGTARLWPIFESTQALIDHARTIVPRQLSDDQRRAFFLSSP